MIVKPIVIAHRGNSCSAPANTIESIRQAIEIGADMIELDVRSSRDGFPVLIHNDTLNETTDGKGKVSSFDLAQLKKLDAGSWKDKQYAGERIPTLMEALEFSKGKVNLSLDLKDENIIPAMLKAVQEADMVGSVVICGCHEPQAKKIWDIDENLTVLLNMDSHLNELGKLEDKSKFINEYIKRACKGKLSALNVSYKFVTYELIRRAHLQALPIWTWTVDEKKDMERLIEMGVDAIYTNYPERLLEVIYSLK